MDWLTEAFTSGPELRVEILAYRLAMAFVLGCVVAGIWRWTHRRDTAPASGFISTLALLAILMAMVTQVIGDNVARAFSLVGALSIVRFRTVVEDTRDTTFVIFAVAVGMAVGAGHLTVALIGLVVVALAAAVVRPSATDWNLTVRVGLGHGPEALLKDAFQSHLTECQLLSTATCRQGAALDLTYRVRLRIADAPNALLQEINGLEGVQSVELRRL